MKNPTTNKIDKLYIRVEPINSEDWLRSENKWKEGQETLGYGYKIQYGDDYFFWSPKRIFERCWKEKSK